MRTITSGFSNMDLNKGAGGIETTVVQFNLITSSTMCD